jgi:hypothetical protein
VPAWGPHLLVASNRRQGRSEEAARAAAQLADSLREHVWPLTLLRASLGEIDATDALAAATDETQRCQVHYYVGVARVARADLAGALAAWAHCAASATPDPALDEKRLAQIETQRAAELIEIERRVRPTMSHQNDETIALRAFLNSDWPQCERTLRVAIARPPFASWVPYALVTSVRRQDRASEADALGDSLLASVADNPWARALCEVFLGRAPLASALDVARDDAQKSQAHFYAGAWLASQGNAAAAREQWDMCRAASGRPLESMFAELECTRLT